LVESNDGLPKRENAMRRVLSQQFAPFVLLLLVACAADTCLAQGPNRSYGGRYRSPYGPTISPYLDYFRRDSGVLDPYNTFIRPRRQLENQLGQMAEDERMANARLQQQIQGIRQETAAPTGRGATFMNYSHYYRASPLGAPRRR
jgi:hypothetical protein